MKSVQHKGKKTQDIEALLSLDLMRAKKTIEVIPTKL